MNDAGVQPPTSTASNPVRPRVNTENLQSGSPPGREPHLQPSSRVAEDLPTQRSSAKKRHTVHGSRGPKWHKDYSQIDPLGGRVLVIDFVKQDASNASVRKVAAQEIYDIGGLQKLYRNPERNNEAVLRVIHVQNADWATRFLLRKFNIENRHDLVGAEFAKFVRRKRPERRGKKPFLQGKTWKVQHDPWRALSKTCFAFDYLKYYHAHPGAEDSDEDDSRKMIELNCFDDEENPVYGYDVYGQRFCCYIQHKHDFPEPPPDLDEAIDSSPDKSRKHHHPQPGTVDNGNAILIFDNARTKSIEDTLIAARDTWEKRWRRLPFFLAFESRDLVATDEQLAFQCSRVIMEDIFRALSAQWDSFLDLSMEHISILEDKVYEQPADETRGPELWLNSSLWLKVERLIYLHIDIIKDLRPRLEELTEDVEADDPWLADISADYDQHSNLVTEDLVKPTENLISLLYQSISIRDSRHNIRLSVSMWRLSWITFVFLPLSFITGFFGMNVDTFESSPDIKYYFISVFPFMTCVLVGWYVLKHFLRLKSQVLSYKGIYENFYNEMANTNPSLWSRHGPRDYIRPKGRIERLKWGLIRRWSAPEKTIKPQKDASRSVDPANDLGSFNRFRRFLIRRWTAQIESGQRPTKLASLEDGTISDINVADNRTPLAGGLAGATEVLVIPATPAAEPAFDPSAPSGAPQPEIQSRTNRIYPSKPSFQSHRRSSSAGNASGIVIEEEDWQWLSQRGKQGKRWAWKPSSSRSRSEERREPGAEKDGETKDKSKDAEVDEKGESGRTPEGSKKSDSSDSSDSRKSTPSPPAVVTSEHHDSQT